MWKRKSRVERKKKLVPLPGRSMHNMTRARPRQIKWQTTGHTGPECCYTLSTVCVCEKIVSFIITYWHYQRSFTSDCVHCSVPLSFEAAAVIRSWFQRFVWRFEQLRRTPCTLSRSGLLSSKWNSVRGFLSLFSRLQPPPMHLLHFQCFWDILERYNLAQNQKSIFFFLPVELFISHDCFGMSCLRLEMTVIEMPAWSPL